MANEYFRQVFAATDLPFIAEFKNKDLALEVCKPDSAEEFTSCIRAVLEKFQRRPEGYSENIEFARQFTWEKRMERILNLVGVKT